MDNVYRALKTQILTEEGFTLVELMVALVILVVGILGVGQIFAFSSRSAAMSRAETTAVALAREIQEKILSESVDQVPAMFGGVDTANPGSVTLPCEEWAGHLADQLGPNGRGRIAVLDAANDPELLDGMYSVLVRVSWLANGDTLTVPIRFAITDISG
jgi:prepilin-type N-terminal cleavage/methylation domain-containing protein